MSGRVNGVRARFADLTEPQIFKILRAWELIKSGGAAQYWLDRINALEHFEGGADWARDEDFLAEIIERNGRGPDS